MPNDSSSIAAVDKLLNEALKGVGIPVSRLFHSEDDDAFITFRLVTVANKNHADDRENGKEVTYGVDMYFRNGSMNGEKYFQMLEAVETNVKKAGFYGFELEAEIYEESTGYYHIPTSIKYFMEV